MKKIYCAIIFLVFLSVSVNGQAWLDDIKSLIWVSKKYDVALAEINSRRPAAGSDVFELDLLKAICYCGNNQPNDGRAYFNWMLRAYWITSQDLKNYIKSSIDNCGSPHTLAQTNNYGTLASLTIATPAIVSGKEFFGMSSEFDQTRVARKIDSAEYTSRLQAATEKDTIRLAAASQLDAYSIASTQNFMVFVEGANYATGARRVAETLEAACQFFVNFYEFPMPEHPITVYISTDRDGFISLGEKLHGLEISYSLIGYSEMRDYSMVAYDPGLNGGTLKHELLHILINQNTPFLPPWISEGVPALYEVSTIQADGQILGNRAWREAALGQIRGNFNPSLERIMNMGWEKFFTYDDQMDNSLIKASLARSFALYLQEQGELSKMFESYRLQDPLEYDPLLITEVLGKQMHQIQEDYEAWLWE
ncbi:MAG: hypothetical protein RLO17_14790 [Cyclobacteriaceae bacterium]|jgi:hypothetical protein